MSSAFERFANQSDTFTELYELVKTAQTIVSGQIFKVEVYKRHASTATHEYIARYYIQETVLLQPEYPMEGGIHQRPSERMSFWKMANDMPSAYGNTADEALSMALHFIGNPG